MTLIEEMMLAARGMVALLLGRRSAPEYFDLGLGGLAGSLVAFLAATAINCYLPYLMGASVEEVGPAWQAVLIILILIGSQILASALILNQFRRADGFVPYLVADNWTTFFVTLITIGVSLTGVDSQVLLFVVGIAALLIRINNARLIVTLTPLQIVGFLLAQLVGAFAGLVMVGLMFGTEAGVPVS